MCAMQSEVLLVFSKFVWYPEGIPRAGTLSIGKCVHVVAAHMKTRILVSKERCINMLESTHGMRKVTYFAAVVNGVRRDSKPWVHLHTQPSSLRILTVQQLTLRTNIIFKPFF